MVSKTTADQVRFLALVQDHIYWQIRQDVPRKNDDMKRFGELMLLFSSLILAGLLGACAAENPEPREVDPEMNTIIESFERRDFDGVDCIVVDTRGTGGGGISCNWESFNSSSDTE